MIGIIEYKGVKLFPLVSEEDNCFCVSIRWDDDTGGYCRGQTVGELKEQIKSVIDHREKQGKSLTLRKSIRQTIGERALQIA